MQIPGTWTPMPLAEKGLVQGPVVPVVMMGCPKCGFVFMFSPQVVPPRPFPEKDVAQGKQGTQG